MKVEASEQKGYDNGLSVSDVITINELLNRYNRVAYKGLQCTTPFVQK